ncbi:MAG: acyl carrier protein [Kitasatospora sp.]|jgi:methoxymalonate biosynthesis acyl carrier protein|nr:acyl carrier protein [Kitasatospora sp.]
MTDSAATGTLTAEQIDAQVKQFLEERTKTSWETGTDLFASGVVSSLFAMELVVFVEKTFDVTVSGPDLRIDHFRTVGEMTALVLRLAAANAGE